jgi:hypothetical protein
MARSRAIKKATKSLHKTCWSDLNFHQICINSHQHEVKCKKNISYPLSFLMRVIFGARNKIIRGKKTFNSFAIVGAF